MPQPVSSNGAAPLLSHGLNKNTGAEIDSQVLTVKTVKGELNTVRVAWILKQQRGVVAVVDLIAAVRGLAHTEAAQFFIQHKENWQRTQSLGLERIALAEITGNVSPESYRTIHVEVCPLGDLTTAIDAIAAVQGQPAGADGVCLRLQNSVQEWARKCLEQRLRELSDDQANIAAALQSIFTVREPHTPMPITSSTATNVSDAPAPVSTSTATLAHMLTSTTKTSTPAEPTSNPYLAEPRSNPATSTSSHSSPYLGSHSSPYLGAHSSPYLGALSAVQPSSGGFWLYDPAPPAPASRGGEGSSGFGRTPSANAASASITSSASARTGTNGSLGGQPPSQSARQPDSNASAAAALSAAFNIAGGACGSAHTANVAQAQSKKRPRGAAACLPSQALSFNQMTGGPELFRCTLCGLQVANRDDGSTLVADVAVAVCGHLYCTGCLAGAILSGLPDEMYKCRRCGLPPSSYDRVRHGVVTQRIELFKVCVCVSARAHVCVRERERDRVP